MGLRHLTPFAAAAIIALPAILAGDRTSAQSYADEIRPPLVTTVADILPDDSQPSPLTAADPSRDWFAADTIQISDPSLNSQATRRFGVQARRGGFVGGVEALTAATYFEDSVSLTFLNNGGNSPAVCHDLLEFCARVLATLAHARPGLVDPSRGFSARPAF